MVRNLLAIALVMLLSATGAAAQEKWTVKVLEDPDSYRQATRDTRQPAPSGIPHMLLETGSASSDIRAAWYAQPTSRYRHGVLGDRIEAGMLVARIPGGRELRYRLPETQVFEDIAPRITDLDGDGRSEIVTILSSSTGGASVAIFGVSGEGLVIQASSGFIGRPNRWLNIAGISNFTGGRTPEIAMVATPHIGGTLGFFKYAPGRLLQFAGERGFSNHVIGSSELRLSAVADVNEDGRGDLAVPSADRKTLLIMGFAGSRLVRLGQADFGSPIDKAIGTTGRGRDTAFLVGTEDGKYHSVSR